MINRFFIIGFQRSGTTLLDYLVNEHPEAVSMCEWELTCMIYSKQKGRLRDITFDSFIKCFNDHEIDQEKYLELVESYLRSELSTGSFIENAYDLGRHSGDIKAVGGKEAVSISHYKYSFIKKLYKDFGDRANIIFIERDIKAVMNSYIKLGFYPPGKQELNDRNLKKTVKNYITCINNTEKYISKFPSVIYIKYENLIRNPQSSLRDIFKFLNVDQSDQVINKILTTNNKTSRINYRGMKDELIEGWKENLSGKMVNYTDSYYEKRRKRYID